LTADQQRLAAAYLPLARKIARRFARFAPDRFYLENYREHIAVCFLRLCQAVRDYDPAQNVKFSTYVYFCLEKVLCGGARRRRPLGYRHNPKRASEVMVPRILPIPEDWNRNDDKRCSAYESQFRLLGCLEDHNAARSGVPAFELRELLDRHMRGLSDRERTIVRLIYDEGLEQTDIAKQLGLSRSRVTHLHAQALAQIRQSIANTGQAELFHSFQDAA
jgi:RNA polymerase sigma factor for flagellar operon FliA